MLTQNTYTSLGYSPFPLPSGAKHPPPPGATGRGATPYTGPWLTPHNVGVHLPDGVIGIDVDDYAAKSGATTLVGLEQRLGPLPPSPLSTSRGPAAALRGVGIRLYRVPEGVQLVGQAGPGIDIIQTSHRYLVVAPSVHPEGGTYTWYDQAGNESKPLPVTSLPLLPDAWLSELQRPVVAVSEASPAQARLFLGWLGQESGDMCPAMDHTLRTATTDLSECESGSRHDAMLLATMRVIGAAAQGHTGVGRALRGLGQIWEVLTEGRESELQSLIRGAAARVAEDWVPGAECTCAMLGAMAERTKTSPPATQPPDPIPKALPATPSLPAQFVPEAADDTAIAAQVLTDTMGRALWLSDSHTWAVLGPTVWERIGSDARPLIIPCIPRAPHGSAAPDADPQLRRQAQVRSRVRSAAGQSAIAAVMTSIVSQPAHSMAQPEARIDVEPDLLWCDGVEYDLRGCTTSTLTPTGQTTPSKPHFLDTGIWPILAETPGFDAFLSALLPDAEVRAWALRCYGIALTGYADAALPILWGPAGTGKTSMVSILRDIVGSYGVTADPRLVSAREVHGAFTKALLGKRLAVMDETPSNSHTTVERLKMLTGGGELIGNDMRENPVCFTPTHTMIFTSNDEPNFSDVGLLRRIKSIYCGGNPEQVREARKRLGRGPGSVFEAEKPAILGRLMVEAGRWLADPDEIDTPASVVAETKTILESQDSVGLWVSDRTSTSMDSWSNSSRLYADYRDFARSIGVGSSAIVSIRNFGFRLTSMGVDKRRTKTGVEYNLQLGSGASIIGPDGSLSTNFF